MKKLFLKYFFEFIVIILGIFVSLLLDQRRQNSIEIDRKNNAVRQLANVIEEDIHQIEGFIHLQNYSLESCNLIFENLNNRNPMENDSIIYHLSSIGRALRSFFPQQGIFDQLVNSDLIKMIESDLLKKKLFKLYNEDLRRHDVHTKEFDKFFLEFNYRLSEQFYLEDSWSTSPIDSTPIVIKGYTFNEEFYTSRKVYADIIESRTSIESYLRELDDLRVVFSELKILCEKELSDTS